MTTVVLGVAVFLFLIIALVGVLMVAKAKLVPSGDVSIIVNGDADKTIKTQAGTTLLGTLAEQKIFIPSACGGKGTCGVCKVHVHSGGGALLPTETSHISRAEEREGIGSLAVQVGAHIRRCISLNRRLHLHMRGLP